MASAADWKLPLLKTQEFQRPPEEIGTLLRTLLPETGGRLPTPSQLLATGRRMEGAGADDLRDTLSLQIVGSNDVLNNHKLS